MNSFINMKGCSSNNIKRNLIQQQKKRCFTSIAPKFRYVDSDLMSNEEMHAKSRTCLYKPLQFFPILNK